jgi:hypothetical protein
MIGVRKSIAAKRINFTTKAQQNEITKSPNRFAFIVILGLQSDGSFYGNA